MSDNRESVTTVDLLRHGRCEGGDIYRGTTNVMLNGEGWQQMERAITPPADWTRIVTSPLLRCRAFAEHQSMKLDLPLSVEPDLRELDFGDWEGRLTKDVWNENPQGVSRYYADPATFTPPGGEATNEAQTRVASRWKRLMNEHRGGTLLLVSHGGVIRLLLSHLLLFPVSSIARLHVPYGALSRVQVYHREEGDFPVLLSLNARTEHR